MKNYTSEIKIDWRTKKSFGKDCYVRLTSNRKVQFAKRNSSRRIISPTYGWFKITRRIYNKLNKILNG
jgi:hypothetical protein